jgi:hypothetical protein
MFKYFVVYTINGEKQENNFAFNFELETSKNQNSLAQFISSVYSVKLSQVTIIQCERVKDV